MHRDGAGRFPQSGAPFQMPPSPHPKSPLKSGISKITVFKRFSKDFC